MTSSMVTTPAVAPNSSTTTRSFLWVFSESLERVGHRRRLGDELGLLHELLHEPASWSLALAFSRSRRRTRPRMSSMFFPTTGIRPNGRVACSRNTSAMDASGEGRHDGARRHDFVTLTSSSERALAMMLDSLLDRVPSFAPRSARRMISSSEPWTLAGGPTKGLTTRAVKPDDREKSTLLSHPIE